MTSNVVDRWVISLAGVAAALAFTVVVGCGSEDGGTGGSTTSTTGSSSTVTRPSTTSTTIDPSP